MDMTLFVFYAFDNLIQTFIFGNFFLLDNSTGIKRGLNVPGIQKHHVMN